MRALNSTIIVGHTQSDCDDGPDSPGEGRTLERVGDHPIVLGLTYVNERLPWPTLPTATGLATTNVWLRRARLSVSYYGAQGL